MNFEVNYKNKKRYKTTKNPMHQSKFWVWLITFLSRIMLWGKEYKVEKINCEDLKPPYMMLSNHMHFIDFELVSQATYPHSVSNVVNIDGYIGKFFLLEWIGAICTRKFTTDIQLVKSIGKVLKRGDVLAMYPEARYTPAGTLNYMPDSLGKLVKMNKVPVVAVVHRGNHLYAPFWNFRDKRRVPFHTTFTKILTPEEIKEMSVEEINQRLREALDYDDYRYQKENGIKIESATRAEGLHKILYKCPACKTEHKMESSGAELFCTECNKRWLWREDGYLEAVNGETEFDHIPDWFNWERQEVEAEIERGEYSYSAEVEVYSLPRIYRYIPLGKAKLTHNPDTGFTLLGEHRGKRYKINRTPIQTNSLHVEYDFGPLDKSDYIDISTENDSFYCRIPDKDMITKLGFATEILYLKESKALTIGAEQKRQ